MSGWFWNKTQALKVWWYVWSRRGGCRRKKYCFTQSSVRITIWHLPPSGCTCPRRNPRLQYQVGRDVPASQPASQKCCSYLLEDCCFEEKILDGGLIHHVCVCTCAAPQVQVETRIPKPSNGQPNTAAGLKVRESPVGAGVGAPNGAAVVTTAVTVRRQAGG